MGIVGYLLDTHTFLWAMHDETKLSNAVKNAVKENSASVYISSVSAYEIMNKYRIGKLPAYAYVAENYLEIFRQFGAQELPITTLHAYYAGKLDWKHRDPFDRLLAAQAVTENMILVTNDAVFDSFPLLSVLW